MGLFCISHITVYFVSEQPQISFRTSNTIALNNLIFLTHVAFKNCEGDTHSGSLTYAHFSERIPQDIRIYENKYIYQTYNLLVSLQINLYSENSPNLGNNSGPI